MGMAAFERAVGQGEVHQFEEATVAALPVSHYALRLPVAAPEKIPRVWLRTGRHVLKGLNDMGRKRDINRSSGLGLIEHQAIAVQPIPLKSDRVADAESAPAHQQGHGAEPTPDGLDVDHTSPRIPVDVRRVENFLELVAREVVGRDLNDLDLAQSHAGILSDVAAADTGPEEADQAALLLLLGQATVRPGAAEGEQDIEVDLVQIVESLDLGSGEKLLAEDGIEL